MDGGRDATKWTNVIGLFQLAGPSNPPNLSLTPCKPYLDVVSHAV